MKWILLFALFATLAAAECVDPVDGSVITESMTFCSTTYDVLNGITVTGSNIVIDCGTAVLRGQIDESEIGLRVEHSRNVTIRNCNILTFNQGLYLKNVTYSLIEDNAFLKNRIGIRMLDSFENVIRNNNDKSHQIPVSAINSKFNVVMLGNKNIDREFCEVNSCNEYRDMDVCQSDDFYCSVKCSAENDADCRPIVPEVEPPVPQKTAEQIIAEVEERVRSEVKQSPIPPPIIEEERELSDIMKMSLFVIVYLMVFIMLLVRR